MKFVPPSEDEIYQYARAVCERVATGNDQRSLRELADGLARFLILAFRILTAELNHEKK